MYDRVENTADRLVTYRQICKQVAREFGVTASFMPKPYNGQMGNGCHHNLSLWAGDTNVIEDAGRLELHVSETARHAIGGMLAHAQGSMAVMASTVNSYKRFWDAGSSRRPPPTGALTREAASSVFLPTAGWNTGCRMPR